MVKIIFYEIFLTLLYGISIIYFAVFASKSWAVMISVPALCGLVGGIGGTLYCLRGVYLNASVAKNWDPAWIPWYYIRPFVSVISGLVSWVFLRAGLLILESEPKPDATKFAYYALAFIAGLNVDKFIAKLEDIAETVWGIRKSRTSSKTEDIKNDG